MGANIETVLIILVKTVSVVLHFPVTLEAVARKLGFVTGNPEKKYFMHNRTLGTITLLHRSQNLHMYAALVTGLTRYRSRQVNGQGI